jgi:phasin
MPRAAQFEFPLQIRELAERNVEQARAACGQFMDAARKAQDMMGTMLPENSLTTGMKQLQERTMRFTRQNMDASFSLASELAKAKDFPEMLQIQSRHAQLQMAAYATQAQELGRLMADAVQNGQIKA